MSRNPSRAAYMRNWRRTRQGQPPHGTNDGYINWRCRCPDCTQAHQIYNQERAARRYLARHGLNLDDVLTMSSVGDVPTSSGDDVPRHPTVTCGPVDNSDPCH